jgi:hypothetical protein
MFEKYRRRWQLSKAKPGDGSQLQRFRFWHLLSRSLFALELRDGSGRTQVFEVDVHHLRDSSSAKRPAALYRDGVQVLQANLPVTFPVPGGVIEVAVGQYGVKRMHHVTDDGREQCCARIRAPWRGGERGSSSGSPAPARSSGP